MFYRITKKPEEGQILVSMILVIPFLMLIIASYLNFSSSSYRVAKGDQLHTMAQMAADAGADYAVEQVNQDTSWASTGGQITLHNDGMIKTTFQATVSDDSTSAKTITVTGRAFWPGGATLPSSTVKINVGLQAVSSGDFSVASGEGGLIMINSSKITGGAVLVNGTVSLANTAQIGLSTSPVDVQVADAVCPVPVDATYPRICTAADGQPQPISIGNTAKIYGSVRANNQTNGANMLTPGLTSSSGVSTRALPTYDRAAQKAAVSTTITGASASCNTNTTRTWTANTKITGDVSISNKCKVTVQGNVWITGNFSMGNTAQLIVPGSAGTTKPIIMIDGSSGAIFNQSAALTPNASGTGFEIITFYSTAACSPDCSSISGTDLNNSRGIKTISLLQSSTAQGTIFYAYWTLVDIGNSGQLGALIGQTIKLENTGTITFTTSAGVGTTSWVVHGYRRAF